MIRVALDLDDTIFDLYNLGVRYLKDIDYQMIEKENHKIKKSAKIIKQAIEEIKI